MKDSLKIGRCNFSQVYHISVLIPAKEQQINKKKSQSNGNYSRWSLFFLAHLHFKLYQNKCGP